MTDTSRKADRIWLWEDGDRRCVSTPTEPYPRDATKYIREDIALDRLIAEAVKKEREANAQIATNFAFKDPAEYDPDLDLVLVRCVVTAPELSDFPRSCELPVSSGDHAVGETFVSIGHADPDGEWFVAGWDMMQDCWTDARCFTVTGWQPLPGGDDQ